MSGRKPTLIEVEVEPIPDINGDEWYAWCTERGFYGLNGGRRAWISDLNTYLRNDGYCNPSLARGRQAMSYEAIDQAVRVLNEALEADPGAMLALMNFGVTVNQTLADHPTIQVWSKEETDGQGYRLRPLGLINGLFGVDIYQLGYIAMSMNEDGTIDKFSRTP